VGRRVAESRAGLRTFANADEEEEECVVNPFAVIAAAAPVADRRRAAKRDSRQVDTGAAASNCDAEFVSEASLFSGFFGGAPGGGGARNRRQQRHSSGKMRGDDDDPANATVFRGFTYDEPKAAPPRASCMEGLLLLDVTPLSIGYAHTCEGLCHWVIPRNTVIPCRKSCTVTAPHDGCTEVELSIIEGSRARAADNNKLDQLTFRCSPPAMKGQAVATLTADIDANGILTVTARLVDAYTGTEVAGPPAARVTITNDKGRLSKDDIDRMVREAEQFKAQDEALIKAAAKQREQECEVVRSLVDGDRMARLYGLPPDVSDATVKRWVGEAVSIAVERCPATGLCAGTALVRYADRMALLKGMIMFRLRVSSASGGVASATIEMAPLDSEMNAWERVDGTAFNARISSSLFKADLLATMGVPPAAAGMLAARGLMPTSQQYIAALADDCRQRYRAQRRRLQLPRFLSSADDAKDEDEAAAKQPSWLTGVPPASGPARALATFLREYSALSDGAWLYPYAVRAAVPALSALEVDVVDEAGDVAATQVQDVYGAGTRSHAAHQRFDATTEVTMLVADAAAWAETLALQIADGHAPASMGAARTFTRGPTVEEVD
jgi:hypothetical protein